MVAVTYTVAFHWVEARPVEVQCAVAPGLPSFQIVGLANKAVSEARKRVRAALDALSIALPSKRITVNLSPADMPKEGSHFDLPIAVALLSALGMIPQEEIGACVLMGELALGGDLVQVAGCLPAALTAASDGRSLICPKASGAEAAWVEAAAVFAAPNLAAVLHHLTGQNLLELAQPGEVTTGQSAKDLSDVKGQERAKRALEIAAAGRHHMLMVGPPGSGKSMLAARLPGLLPPLSPAKALETSMIHSLAGLLDEGGISRERPFREPHSTASMAAIIGGGRSAKPGEVSLAHNGVLFMDEFPEFPRHVLETLRQPIETGEVMVARANAHVKYPSRFMLIAAANPCRCGYMSDPARACARAPECGADYLGRISGPLLDRFDLRVDVPPVAYSDLELPCDSEPSAEVARRIAAARDRQATRYAETLHCTVNADAEGSVLQKFATPSLDGQALLLEIAERFGLTARGYHRVMRVARTIADLAGSEAVERAHIAEAASFRLPTGQIRSQPRNSRKAAAAAQPEKMAMANDSRP
ncbi:YifB family Mg chelatase-like AAA ATPase [Planktomarina temperata]|nr:YifB family Mg chelatase-like AAA ATPase [Planktomarina temperata]